VTAPTTFSAAQFANPYPDDIQHHYWTLARNALVLNTLRKQMADPAGIVCDVGCGRGITVEYLRRYGITAIGADTGTPRPIVPEVAPYLHLGQDALALPLDVREQVRVILLLDVLEHLPAPATFVASLANAFHACRDIIVTVPARQELWSNYDEYYGHRRRYDLGSLETLYPQNAFEPTSARYAFRLLYAPALALRLTRTGRSVSIAAPPHVLRPLHRLIAGYFRLESALLPGWIAGTSVVMTLRRREGSSQAERHGRRPNR
jgi:hypothetical protein